MSDVCDGNLFRIHPLYSCDPHALQIILYYDDLEVCNPLGSSVKKHKLGKDFKSYSLCLRAMLYMFVGAFYFVLGNLSPRNRSLLHSIQLVALAKTSLIQSYGIDVILQPFMESIHKLERVRTIPLVLHIFFTPAEICSVCTCICPVHHTTSKLLRINYSTPNYLN